MKKIFLLILFCKVSFAQVSLLQQNYDGYIDGKIPVSLSFTTDDNLIYGTLIYKKFGIPIKIIGTLNNNNILFYEFAPKAEVTGIFSAAINGNELSGQWENTSGKTLVFKAKNTSNSSITKSEIKSVQGTYAYSMGKNGATGSLYVQQLDKENIIVEIQAVKGAPSYNQAIIQKTNLHLDNNQAIYTNYEFGKCMLKIIFFDGGATIIYLENGFDCGFGNAASVVGNYIKYDNKAPSFE